MSATVEFLWIDVSAMCARICGGRPPKPGRPGSPSRYIIPHAQIRGVNSAQTLTDSTHGRTRQCSTEAQYCTVYCDCQSATLNMCTCREIGERRRERAPSFAAAPLPSSSPPTQPGKHRRGYTVDAATVHYNSHTRLLNTTTVTRSAWVQGNKRWTRIIIMQTSPSAQVENGLVLG